MLHPTLTLTEYNDFLVSMLSKMPLLLAFPYLLLVPLFYKSGDQITPEIPFVDGGRKDNPVNDTFGDVTITGNLEWIVHKKK